MQGEKRARGGAMCLKKDCTSGSGRAATTKATDRPLPSMRHACACAAKKPARQQGDLTRADWAAPTHARPNALTMFSSKKPAGEAMQCMGRAGRCQAKVTANCFDTNPCWACPCSLLVKPMRSAGQAPSAGHAVMPCRGTLCVCMPALWAASERTHSAISGQSRSEGAPARMTARRVIAHAFQAGVVPVLMKLQAGC